MSIQAFYHHLTTHVVPGPQSFSYFIPLPALAVAVLVPRSTLSRWQNVCVFMPIIAGCTIDAWIQIGGIDVVSMNLLLWSLCLLVHQDPWKNFRRVRMLFGDEKSNSMQGLSINSSHGQPNTFLVGVEHVEGEPYPSKLKERAKWAGTLLVSLRFENWKIGLPSHDGRQPSPPAFESRRHFFKQALINFVRGYLILELTSAYTRYDLYFMHHDIKLTSPLPFTSFQIFIPRLFRSTVVGIQAWALVSQLFYLPCLFPVALNALGILADEWSPHNWAPYFGSAHMIFLHGLRGFWGRYWHQTMRHVVSAPGYAFADRLGLRHGGLWRYAIITFVAFLLSGIVHMGLVPPEPLYATVTPNVIRLYIAAFFGIQPVAMLAEVIMMRIMEPIVKATTLSAVWKLCFRVALHACWLTAWFSLCLPLLGEAGKQLGYWRVWLTPLSMYEGIRGQGWIAWPCLAINQP